MAQADQVVQNASFPSVRADINDNLAALYSQSSGNSEPAATVAFQPWIDTSSSPAVWKIRNATNNGWITVGTIDATTFNISGLLTDGSVTTAKLADSAVTSAKIADGAIVNADINASAGIVDTKLTGTTCKAWVNFNGSGVVAIRASYNVSSITDNGTGDYTVNFTTALADANYAVITGATGAWATNNTARSIGISSTTAPTASAVRIVNIGTGTAEDTAYQQIAIFR